MIPLAEALLCCQCERIVTTSKDYCPACGSFGLLSLARVLGQTVPQRHSPPATALPIPKPL